MVVAETSVHEACRTGNAKIVKLLLDANPGLQLNEPGKLGLAKDGFDQTCILVAVSSGHIGIVSDLLRVCADLALIVDKNGNSPLHYASSKGQREITRAVLWTLLKLNPKPAQKAQQYNHNGHTPLHLAAINYRVPVLEVFLLLAEPSFQVVTKSGETVFHLAVRYGRYNALVYLTTHVSNDIDFFDCRDLYGNTILHLAISEAQHKVRYEGVLAMSIGSIETNNCSLYTNPSKRHQQELSETLYHKGSIIRYIVQRRYKMPVTL
ncbi:unnamed protein product [Prunus brigantina]